MAVTSLFFVFLTVSTVSQVHSRSCLPGWQAGSGDNNCYLFKLTTKSWDDALSVCHGMKSSLLTIESREKEAWVRTAVSRLRGVDVTVKWWVGVSRAPGLNSSWVWTDGSTLNLSITPWLPEEPHLVTVSGKTTRLCAQYKFHTPPGLKDKLCTIQNSFICQRSLDAPSFCDTDNGWFEHHDMCYKYFESKIPWDEARVDCENHGAVLASPLTAIAEQNVFDIAIDKRSEIWLGLYTKVVASSVSWHWVDGSSFGNTFWASNQPSVVNSQKNSSCATISPGVGGFRKAWIVRPCQAEKSYLCQKPEGSCAPGWKSFGETCYQFDIKFFLTWDDAVKHCQQQGAKLLQIRNGDTQAFINSYLEELRRARIDTFWIGLNDPGGSGVYTWSDGSTLSGYKKFPVDVIRTGSRLCQYISTATTDGLWISGGCLVIRPFVCEAPSDTIINDITTPLPTFTCDANWIPRGKQCYLFNDTEVTWSQARQSCQAMDGDLVRVTDSDIQSFINEHLTKSKWIGLNDLVQEGKVVWLNDTEQPTYFNLDTRHRNDFRTDCAFVADGTDGRLSTLGRWVITGCTIPHGFICQKQAANVGVLTLPPTTTQVVWTSGCGPGWEQNAQSCYMFREEQKSWTDARDVCRHNGGDLASISDAEEQGYVTGRVKSLSSPWLWLGARDLTVEGGWEWADNSPLAYINWNSGQPDNMANSDCAALYTVDGTWNDLTCNTQNGFICKRKAGSHQTSTSSVTLTTVPGGMRKGCESGWSDFAGYCYRVRHNSDTWTDALKGCIQQDANLVSIRDVSEQNFILSLMNTFPIQAWIGLNSRRKVHSYEWSDNTAVTYTHWRKDEPNNPLGGVENCVIFNIHGQGYWSDVDCNLATVPGYICKKPQTLTPTGTPSSDVGCTKRWIGYGLRCYFFVEIPKTFSEAESLCKQGFGHLVVVNDRYVQAFLTEELSSRSGDYWIGLQTYRTGTAYYYWIDKTRVRYTNWDRSHTGHETHSCVSIKADHAIGLWVNSPCASTQKAFICQAKRTLPSTTRVTTPSTVPPVRCRRNYLEYQGFCYRLLTYSNRYTWFEAVNACNREGSNLISLHNSSEVNWIRSRLVRYSYKRKSYWLGLNIIDRSRGYTWGDNSPLTYTMWANGQPDNHNDQEDCVEWDTRSNIWRDDPCYVRRAVICKYRKGALPIQPTIPPTTKPPINCGRPPNWQYFNGSCYYFSRYSSSKNWFMARDYCTKTIGGELLSIGSQDENNFILSVISKNGGSYYWTGLNELNLEGYEWSDGDPLVFTNWAVNEPSDSFGGEKCIEIYNGNGYWHDLNCASVNPFICKLLNGTKNSVPVTPTPEMPGNCHEGWNGHGNKCYKVFDISETGEGVNWTAALSSCHRLGKGYDLVAIGDFVEQIFVTYLLRSYNSSYWIGFNQLMSYRKFVWTDNSAIGYTNWDRGEPNGDRRIQSRKQSCVEIRTHETGVGKWADNHCTLTQGYVCQGYKDPAVKFPVTTALPSWCKAGYTVYGNSCYMIKADNQTWNEAYTTCKSDGGNLASISDQFEENFIRLLNDGEKPTWIGLSDRELKGIYRWSDGWPVSYTHWGRGEPSRSPDEGCVAMLKDATWTDTVCNQTYTPVCEINSGTPPPYTTPIPGYCRNKAWVQFDGYCFYLLTSYTSWADANFNCKQMHMRLATLQSDKQTKFVVSLFRQKRIRTEVWIGMVNAERAGFKWDDGTPVSYTNWGKNEPSNPRTTSAEDCVKMSRTTGVWDDRICTARYNALCMAEFVMPTASTETTVKLTTGISTAKAIEKSTAKTSPNVPRKTSIMSTPVTPQTEVTATVTRVSPPVTSLNVKTGTQNKRSTQMSPSVTSLNVQTGAHIEASSTVNRVSGHPGMTTTMSSHTANKYRTNQHNTKPGSLKPGAIAGICIGAVLAVVIVALGVIFARKRGYMSFTPRTAKQSLKFDNALYTGVDEDGTVQ